MDHSAHQTSASSASTRVVDVLVPVALEPGLFLPRAAGMELKAGDVVGVPLGPREVLAVVWAENAIPIRGCTTA